MISFRIVSALALSAAAAVGARAAGLPEGLSAPGDAVVLEAHAVGAQIYECKASAGSQPTWQFREPIASLLRDGTTVGRHYAGPAWEIGGSTVLGTVVARAPGASAKDVPWLRLEVASRAGDGPLREATAVERINTSGGNFAGGCDKIGELHAEPYSADYVFVRSAP